MRTDNDRVGILGNISCVKSEFFLTSEDVFTLKFQITKQYFHQCDDSVKTCCQSIDYLYILYKLVTDLLQNIIFIPAHVIVQATLKTDN